MLKFVEDSEIKRPAEVGPGAYADWQTPPATLTLWVEENRRVSVTLDAEDIKMGPRLREWSFGQKEAQTHIPRILDALKKFRESQTAYWSRIGPDIQNELAGYKPIARWRDEHLVKVDPADQQVWDETVATDPNLWDLAKSSNTLYNAVFPAGSWLRQTLDELEPGSMIDIGWLNVRDNYVANIPWGLLYRSEPGKGEPISATDFWALRYRLDYQTYTPLRERSRALGDPSVSRLGHAYYWKGGDQDIALKEAHWQRKQWEGLDGHYPLPDKQDANPKDRLIRWLANPQPNPMPVLYLYCKARVDNTCSLEFGKDNLNKDSVTIRDLDLPNTPFTDVQFVFCNACESGMKQGAQAANLLEQHFFTRGCTAFLGTVHETPIELASRFAAVFFHFFYERVDGKVVSAGEAAVQARRFLWLKYRNVGGLFYNYVNEYDLYLANEVDL